MAYDKRFYEQAENEIKQRRLRSESALNARIRETEKLIPEIAEINSQLSSVSIELTKLILRRDKDFKKNFDKIREQNLQGQDMIKALLKSKGLPENYLEPSYYCNVCRDTGYVNGERCQCFKKLLNKLAVDSLNEKANMPECDFEHFSLSYYDGKTDAGGMDCRRKMEENLNFCMEYAGSFSENSPSLLFIGKTGLGKTHRKKSRRTGLYRCIRFSVKLSAHHRKRTLRTRGRSRNRHHANAHRRGSAHS